MKPTPQEYRTAEKWSSLLRTELGYPPYSWQWSEDLVVRMRDKEHGYDHYANPETGLIELRPKWISRTICDPLVVNQWVLCKLITTDKRQWLAQFRDEMEWPENGRWTPCNGPGGYVALPPLTIPDREQTWKVIRAVRETRAETLADFKAGMEQRRIAREAANEEARREYFEDLVPRLLEAPQNTVYSLGGDSSSQKEVTQ